MAAEPERRGPHAPEATRVPLALEEWAAAAVMAALFLITLANVLVRHFTDASFAFTEEWSIALMVVLTLLGAGSAAATGRHIRIGFFADRARPALRRACAVLAPLATAIMFAIIAWYGGLSTWQDWDYEVTSPALDWPAWIYSMWLPLLSLAVIGRCLGRIVRLLRTDRP